MLDLLPALRSIAQAPDDFVEAHGKEAAGELLNALRDALAALHREVF